MGCVVLILCQTGRMLVFFQACITQKILMELYSSHRDESLVVLLLHGEYDAVLNARPFRGKNDRGTTTTESLTTNHDKATSTGNCFGISERNNKFKIFKTNGTVPVTKQ